MKALNFSIEPDRIDKTMVEKLYGDTLKTSVSRLEHISPAHFHII